MIKLNERRMVPRAIMLGCATAVLAAAGGLLAGCEVKEDYRLAKTSVAVDPKTGHLIRTNLYEYGDGTTETTTYDITAQGNDEDRRDPPSHYSFIAPPGFF